MAKAVQLDVGGSGMGAPGIICTGETYKSAVKADLRQGRLAAPRPVRSQKRPKSS